MMEDRDHGPPCPCRVDRGVSRPRFPRLGGHVRRAGALRPLGPGPGGGPRGRPAPLRGGADRSDQGLRPGRHPARRVPRRLRSDQPRRRARPARPGLRPRLRHQRPLLRQLHRHGGDTADRALRRRPDRPRPRAGRPAPRPCSSDRPALHATTTAATSSSAPTACSTSAWATAAAAAIPATAPRTRSCSWARCCASTSTWPSATAIPADNPFVGEDPPRRDLGLRPAQPLALLLRPRHRRPLHRRRGPERARGDRRPARVLARAARTTAGASWRAPTASTRRRTATTADRSTLPIHEYTHGGSPFRCSITGGYVYRGDDVPELWGHYFFADYCSDQIWALHLDRRERPRRGDRAHRHARAAGRLQRDLLHRPGRPGRALRARARPRQRLAHRQRHHRGGGPAARASASTRTCPTPSTPAP